jgi:hypothetical protein
MYRKVFSHKQIQVLFFCIYLVGCAGTPMGSATANRASSTTDLLTQAGFRAEPAKKPEHLQALPGGQFVIVHWQGRTVYVYTDPDTRQLYFGSEAAYQRYLSMASAQAAETPQPHVSSQASMSAFDWQMYGSLHGLGP